MALFMLILSLAAAITLVADTAPRSHADCVALTTRDAFAGLDYAEAWEAEAGGRPARHCLALANLAMDRPEVAGDMLVMLAKEERQDPGVAARLYLQGAEALMAGGRKEDSLSALQAAYDLAGDEPEVHLSAAGIYATADDWEGVIRTLDRLENRAALSADALTLRGRAYYSLEKFEEAARDASRALHLDPYLIDAIVLRGDLLNNGKPLPDDPFAR